MNAITLPKSQKASSVKNLRRHRTGGGYAAYEAAKNAWDAANPRADWQTREQAMRRIANSLGV